MLLFLPHIVTPVVAALFLRWIFMGRWGLIDGILISFNIFPPDWLGSPDWARFVVVLADAWQFTPFMILVLYAGLNTVDQSQIESAQMDGAGNWTLLTRVMLPAIKALIVFVLAVRTMDAFRFFDSDLRADRGRPGHRDRDHHHLHLCPRLSPARGRQGLGARRPDAADRGAAGRGA